MKVDFLIKTIPETVQGNTDSVSGKEQISRHFAMQVWPGGK